jgi:hypothetical protein
LSQEVPNIVETSGHRQKVLLLKKINLIWCNYLFEWLFCFIWI